MKEIGGYIEFEHNHGRMLHAEAIHLNCARRALSYLIDNHGIKQAWIPKFTCSSVTEPFSRAKCEIKFYSINERFEPLIEDIPRDDWVVVINYYGQLSNNWIQQEKERHPRLIVDNTQAYFQLPVKGVETIYSCRKFFGVPDGAILYSEVDTIDFYETDESYNRMTHLLGRFEHTAEEFYSDYVKNEERFNEEKIKQMSRLTKNILCGIDYKYVERLRTENYSFLNEKFKIYNKLQLHVPDGPFMYPLYLDNGAEIRKALISKKIYIPQLWPDVFAYAEANELEYRFSKNILPIPVDQRYDPIDMKIISDEIERIINQ